MNEHHRAVEEEVRELLVRAGPRPAAPPEEVAAIREAARDEWRRLVAGERRRRLRLGGGVALAASVLLAVVAVWWWVGRAPALPPALVASVELVAGDVRITPPPAARTAPELEVGSRLPAGSTLETMGRGGDRPGRLALALGGGSLRLDAETRVRLVSERRLELERGAVYFDSGGAARAGSAVAIVTPLATVRDVGTQFEVRLGAGDSALRVRVREGRVALEAAGGSHLAAGGDQLSLHGDGSVARAAVEPYGPEWDWVVAAAPLPEIDGRSLESFLDWYMRETGRQVRYADPSLADLAASNLVYSPIDGLSAEQALVNVLRGSELAHQVENGTLLVRRLSRSGG